MSINTKVILLLKRLFPGCVTSNMMNVMLRERGINVGEGTVFFDAGNINIDTSRPELLSIGCYCKITSGTIVLTHDYSRSVLRMKYGEVIGEARKTLIGDNVFIGVNSIILMGCQIGNNSIVGAGSVCAGTYPDNSVIAGNPAKVICTLDEYYKKRKDKYIDEAVEYALLFKNYHKRYPSIHEMGAFFPLYLERSESALQANNIRTKLSGDNEIEVINCFMNTKPVYRNYDEFITVIKGVENEREDSIV